MQIAVNGRCLVNTQFGPGYYTLYLFDEIVKRHPGVNITLISNVPLTIEASPNVSVKIISQSVKTIFGLRRWYSKKVKKELTNMGADVFISLDGSACLTTDVPQIVGVTDLKFLDSGSYWHKRFLKIFVVKCLQKAAGIITVSNAVKNEMKVRLNTDERKITIVPKAAKKTFMPVEWEQREEIKNQFSEGKDFFLFAGGFDPKKNLLNVLKAFSKFKTWQQSNMKLLIAGNTENDPDDFKTKIEKYKFKNDVTVLGKIDAVQLSQLLASSYALIFTSVEETYGMPVLEAMKCATAVIVSDTSAVVENMNDAVLIADPNNPDEISAQMIKLYKDEALRSRLVENGLEHLKKINWETSAEKLWQLIEKVVTTKAE